MNGIVTNGLTWRAPVENFPIVYLLSKLGIKSATSLLENQGYEARNLEEGDAWFSSKTGRSFVYIQGRVVELTSVKI